MGGTDLYCDFCDEKIGDFSMIKNIAHGLNCGLYFYIE
jgi:hypothetical protein